MKRRKLLALCIGIIWAIAFLKVDINFAVIMGLALAMIFGLFDSEKDDSIKQITMKEEKGNEEEIIQKQ
ncbi:hypothetical protein D6855_16115 [Butyrivibrio sp. CB08]|uniref:hypothetical protein n=1 Tax=Butyrivibrio sp. CB08 TaxID=2364879 RepID=UPI000EA90AF5|nr:hypothetical protein [Butyrivibrio sp. CB08]RKM55366.1 hypothetical protein D6855_16115 [Butyrivibrio sp. CB08]